MQDELVSTAADGTVYLSSQGIIELAYQDRMHILFEWQDAVSKKQFIDKCMQLDNWPFDVNAPDVDARTWFTPGEYASIDLEDYFIARCSNTIQKARALLELDLVKNLNAEQIFKHLIYLVDVWRTNNLVWGVGRGSSVSCFLLYLIGINKINPLDFDLDHREFFKV